MSLNAVRHGLGRVERDVRRQGLDGDTEPKRTWDPSFATFDELEQLSVAFEADDQDEFERILAIVEERRAKGERPLEDDFWGRSAARTPVADVHATSERQSVEVTDEPVPSAVLPAATPAVVAAVADARAQGHEVLVAGDVLVEIAFNPRSPAAPLEPEDVEAETAVRSTYLTRSPVCEATPIAPVPAASRPGFAGVSARADSPSPRQLSMTERAHHSGRRKRWHGDEAPDAAWILEREF